MPRIASIGGVSLRMYVLDHPPPHFHAQYGEHSAMIEIEGGRILMGSLPPAKAKLVLAWADAHRDALKDAWALAAQNKHPGKIDD